MQYVAIFILEVESDVWNFLVELLT